jgi:hypothetical protein
MNPPKHTSERLDVDRWGASGMRWIAVTEQLPDDEETVLVFCDGEPWTGFVDGKEWFYVCGDPIGAHVTHWMPFPDGPGSEQVAE